MRLVRRTFKYILKPTKLQRFALERIIEQCRQLYNAALAQRIWAYRIDGKGLGLYDQYKELTELRAADQAFSDVSVTAQRSALRRLDKAYENFFRRVKENHPKPGFPRFRGKERYDSFGIGRVLPQNEQDRHAHLRVPNVGLLRFKLHRRLRWKEWGAKKNEDGRAVEVKNTELKRDARGRWYVCFSCDVGPAPAPREPVRAIGVDLGLKEFAVLSDGTKIENPRFFRRAQERLALRQQRLARRKKGSKSRARARLLVARGHEKIKNQRRNFHIETARELCKSYDLIAYEDLNVKGLVQSNLAKSISDAGWGNFTAILRCKAEEAGARVVAVNPRNTTQKCSQCGMLVPKTLADRVHQCPFCGYVADRDVNAALNILALGQSAVLLPGGKPPSKARSRKRGRTVLVIQHDLVAV